MKSKFLHCVLWPVTVALAGTVIGLSVAYVYKPTTEKYNYDVTLADDSFRILDNGIRSNNTTTIQALTLSKNNSFTPLYSANIISGGQYATVVKTNDDIFEIHTNQVSQQEYVVMKVIARINDKDYSDNVSFSVLPPFVDTYKASTHLSITANQSINTTEYESFSASAIGNLPIYELQGYSMTKNNNPFSDYDVVFSSTNTNVVRIINDPKGVNKIKYLQILNTGSSIVSAQYYDKSDVEHKNLLYQAQRTWNLDSDDITSSLYDRAILVSDNYGVDGKGQVKNNDTANISFAQFNGFDLPKDVNKIFNWIFASHSAKSEWCYIDGKQFPKIQFHFGPSSGSMKATITLDTTKIQFGVKANVNGITEWTIGARQE